MKGTHKKSGAGFPLHPLSSKHALGLKMMMGLVAVEEVIAMAK